MTSSLGTATATSFLNLTMQPSSPLAPTPSMLVNELRTILLMISKQIMNDLVFFPYLDLSDVSILVLV